MIAPINGRFGGHMSRVLGPDGRPYRWGYDATEPKNRRRPSTGLLKSEDRQLPQSNRRDLVSEMRDLHRNFSLAAWAIRKHLDFVSSFAFRSKTGDKALDNRIEELMNWFSRPNNCDVAGRHPLRRMIRLAEARRTVDGDVFLLKLRDGRLQAIEGDRIRTPLDRPKGFRAKELTHGVRVNDAGRALGYLVCRRGTFGNGFHFERMVPAHRMLQHAFFDRFDQVRGITPMASGYNSFQDTYEGITYALLKAKIAQLFGLVVTRNGDGDDSMGHVTNANDDGDDTTESNEEKSGYQIDFGQGPFFQELEPGDEMKFLENKTPSAEFREFLITVIALSLKSLDIPFSFYDEAWTNFFGSKAALALYLKSCKSKRADVQDLLRQITVWRQILWIADGVLELPRGVRLPDLAFEWIPDGMPWWDQSKEVKGDVMAVSAGLRSRTEIRKERFGDDWFDVIDQLATEEDYIREKRVSIVGANGSIYDPEPAAKKGDDDDED